MAGDSLFRITEQQLQAHENQVRNDSIQNTEPVLSIASYVRSGFSVAKSAWENELHDRLLKCVRQKKGEYDPDILAKIRDAIPGGSENYRNITLVKCKSFEAWADASLFPVGDKCWTIMPSPDPEIPDDEQNEVVEVVTAEAAQIFLQNGVDYDIPEANVSERIIELQDKIKKEIYKKAKLSAKRVEQKMDDYLTEGGYYEAISQCVLDMSYLPVCWLVGPEVTKKKAFKWEKDIDGNNKRVVTDKIVRRWRRVSPFNVFLSPNSKGPQDGDLYELIDLKRSELAAMIGVEGFDEPTIRTLLAEYGTQGHTEWLSSEGERNVSENNFHYDDDPNPPIQAINMWGEIPGRLLIEWGMDMIADPDLDYQINCWLIGEYVVMCRLNPSPLGTKPYYCTSYDKDNDSWIGQSIPEIIRDDQLRCCACARAIDNNMAFASGPLWEFFADRFAPGTNFQSLIRPFGYFVSSDSMTGGNNPAMRVYNHPFVANLMLQVDDYFQKQAGEKTIPSYVSGQMSDTGGPLNTASGTSMMLNASLKNLRGAIKHLETDIIIPSIVEMWNHIMHYDDDIEKFGDVAVVAKVSEHLLVEEQRQLRAQEMLDRVDRSETLKAIAGTKGMATLFREALKITKINPDEIVPSEEEMEHLDQVEQGGQPGGYVPVQQPPELNPAVIAPDGSRVGDEVGRLMS